MGASTTTNQGTSAAVSQGPPTNPPDPAPSGPGTSTVAIAVGVVVPILALVALATYWRFRM
ncbi:hypothetical protein HDU76_010178, partial [Blyttiomyces sp. JEL0837]